MKGFYSPIDQLAAQLPRAKGTGAEFMTELSKRPGYKPQEAQDRGLQALINLPKMERAQFLAALKAKPPVIPNVVENDGTDDPRYLTPEERNYGGNEGQAFHEQYTLPGGKNYREILLQHPQGKFKGVSEHFGGEPNILASIRVKDRLIPDLEGPHNVKVIEGNRSTNVKHKTREDAERFADIKHQGGYRTEITPLNNKKILHIEEIQSDWHQQGRDKGYLAPDTPKQLEAAKLAHLRLKEQLEDAKSSSDSYERKLKSDMPLYQDPVVRQRLQDAIVKHNNDIMDLMPQVMKAEAARRGLEEEAKYGVPDAPFKKNWHELALKKMIHHAAEKGYDSIAITPGKEQASRYGLAKKLHSLEYSKGNDGKYHVIAIPHSGADLMGGTYDLPELERHIGKDLTKQIAENQGEAHPHNDAYKTLSGKDLDIGGEGMKGFYDKMIPSFLNQFGKKYGAQVGTMPLPVEGGIEPGWVTKPAAPRAVPVHHFPITPQMREDVTKNGVPLYAKGGSVEDEGDAPKKTVKAYKLFRVHPKHPGKLFPLFVDANTPVEMDKWINAKEGEMAKGKVKSKIGPLAYRPGWHAGDLPIATHIGEKSDPSLIAPDVRPDNHAWAEVEMPNDVDWQAEATKRGTNAQGRVIPVKAHITDQIPKGGHYRYKTNPNMTGNWLIGGSMKVNRVLTDKEVAKINKAAGLADLPRAQPFKAKKFGFAGGGTVGPEEWMAEEHVNHRVLPTAERKANLAKFLKGSKIKHPVYHGTADTQIREFNGNRGVAAHFGLDPKVANQFAQEKQYDIDDLRERGEIKPHEEAGSMVYPAHVQVKNIFDVRKPEHHKLIPRLHERIKEGYQVDFTNLEDALPEIKKHGFDSYYDFEYGHKHDKNPTGLAVFRPHQIKSAIGNRGTYDTTKADITKAKGGSIKPIGYTKEKVTVSPNLNQMRYELMSVKHYVKKAK